MSVLVTEENEMHSCNYVRLKKAVEHLKKSKFILLVGQFLKHFEQFSCCVGHVKRIVSKVSKEVIQ